MKLIRDVIGVIALAIPLHGASAQVRIERDPVTSDYLVSYEVDGRALVARVPARDLIEPEFLLDSVRGRGPFEYFYTLQNHQGIRARAGRGIWLGIVPCADADAGIGLTAPSGWIGERLAGSLGASCQFTAGGELSLDPGESAGPFVIRSHYLMGPMPGLWYGVGGATVVAREEVDTPAPVLAVIDSLGALGGSVAGTSSLGLYPVRDPGTLIHPVEMVLLLAADLRSRCSDPEWFRTQGLCQSIAAKVEGVANALAEDRNRAAAGKLGALLDEARAQRGKGVSESAYQLIRFWVVYITERV